MPPAADLGAWRPWKPVRWICANLQSTAVNLDALPTPPGIILELLGDDPFPEHPARSATATPVRSATEVKLFICFAPSPLSFILAPKPRLRMPLRPTAPRPPPRS